MHELTLVRDLVATSLEAARGRPIRRVVLEVGALSGAVPDALRFAFEAVCAETPLLEGAELEILASPARVRCRECRAESEVRSAWDSCPCGSLSLEWLEGTSLLLRSLEVARV